MYGSPPILVSRDELLAPRGVHLIRLPGYISNRREVDEPDESPYEWFTILSTSTSGVTLETYRGPDIQRRNFSNFAPSPIAQCCTHANGHTQYVAGIVPQEEAQAVVKDLTSSNTEVKQTFNAGLLSEKEKDVVSPDNSLALIATHEDKTVQQGSVTSTSDIVSGMVLVNKGGETLSKALVSGFNPAAIVNELGVAGGLSISQIIHKGGSYTEKATYENTTNADTTVHQGLLSSSSILVSTEVLKNKVGEAFSYQVESTSDSAPVAKERLISGSTAGLAIHYDAPPSIFCVVNGAVMKLSDAYKFDGSMAAGTNLTAHSNNFKVSGGFISPAMYEEDFSPAVESPTYKQPQSNNNISQKMVLTGLGDGSMVKKSKASGGVIGMDEASTSTGAYKTLVPKTGSSVSSGKKSVRFSISSDTVASSVPREDPADVSEMVSNSFMHNVSTKRQAEDEPDFDFEDVDRPKKIDYSNFRQKRR